VPIEYSQNINIADSLFLKLKKYCDAGLFYNKAFNNIDGYAIDYHRLQAARSWAKCGQRDSTLANLYFLVYTMSFSDWRLLDSEFKKTKIYSDSRFNNVIRYCKCSENIKTQKFDSTIARIFDSLYLVDQSTRSITDENIVAGISTNPGSQKSNLRLLDSIYQIYGWLSSAQVGYNGSLVQFLIIQHDDLETQNKWLPIVRKAVDSCLLAPGNYALLIDRILVRSGKKQIFGTQSFFDYQKNKFVPYPIRKYKKVNKRRMENGMSNLELYLMQLNKK
jgi:hypothetical protein